MSVVLAHSSEEARATSVATMINRVIAAAGTALGSPRRIVHRPVACRGCITMKSEVVCVVLRGGLLGLIEKCWSG